jgi:predicted secreted protein
MLTLDDLDHFDDRSTTPQTAPTIQPNDAQTLMRLARIVACLNFCRDIPNEELAEGGLHAARRVLRSALRSEQRRHRLPQDELMASFEGALLELGDKTARRGEPVHAAAERHAVEAEIQTAAAKLAGKDTVDPDLMESLAAGEFEILPSSDFAPLTRTMGKFAAPISVDVDLAVDGAGPAQVVRVRLLVESGFWRWTAQDGCCMSRNGDPAVFMSPDDGVVQALLAGLSLRSGRAIVAWAEAAGEELQPTEAQPA